MIRRLLGLSPRASSGETTAVLNGDWYGRSGSIPLVPSMGRMRSATYRQIYLTNPWVWASVNMLARGVGRLPLHVYALDDRGRKTRVRGDVGLTPGRPLAGQTLDRLLSRPSAGISRNSFFAGTMRDWLVYGNALWEIERESGGGLPSGLSRVEWRDVVRVVEGKAGRASAYELRDRERLLTRGVLAGDVVHFGLGSDEGALGVSPLESCRHTLALHDALVRHLVAFFGNSMRPSGHISVDKLTEAKAEQIRQAIEELYASPENAGRVLITSGKWEGVADTLEHSQIIELIKASREEIAAAYSVPPPVLGILDQAIKSNVKELREHYGRESLGPWASDFEQELMAQLVAPQASWRGHFVEFQLAELLRPDLEARAMVYQRMQSVLTIDEIRGFENLPALDIPGVTDVPWAQSGAMPLTTAARGKQTDGGSSPAAMRSEELTVHLDLTGGDQLAADLGHALGSNGHRKLKTIDFGDGRIATVTEDDE